MQEAYSDEVTGQGHIGHIFVDHFSGREYKGTSYWSMCPTCPQGHIGHHVLNNGEESSPEKVSVVMCPMCPDRARRADRALFSYSFYDYFSHIGVYRGSALTALFLPSLDPALSPEHCISDAGGVSPAPLYSRDPSHPQDAGRILLPVQRRAPLCVAGVTREAVA